MEMSRTNKVMVGAFAALMIGHWLEHIFQAYQVYVMHMPRACALGMLGMKYPWLVKTESLHFGFAVFTTIGLLMLWHCTVTGKWPTMKSSYARSAPSVDGGNVHLDLASV